MNSTPCFLQEIDALDRLFLGLVALVSVRTQRLVGDGPDGFYGRFVLSQSDLDFEYRERLGLLHFLPCRSRIVDAD